MAPTNLSSYRHDRSALERKAVEDLANTLKRDIAIVFSLIGILLLMDHLRLVPIPTFVFPAVMISLILLFLFRIKRVIKTNEIFFCTYCGKKLAKIDQADERFIVCHDCQLIAMKLERSDGPDRQWDEV